MQTYFSLAWPGNMGLKVFIFSAAVFLQTVSEKLEIPPVDSVESPENETQENCC